MILCGKKARLSDMSLIKESLFENDYDPKADTCLIYFL